MAYELIIDNQSKKIEVHSDLCDVLMNTKDNFELNNVLEYIKLVNFEEVEGVIGKEEYKDFEVIYCDECKPKENRALLDEEYDDFYEEFDEDDEIDNSRCDIF
jgi:hypothetical protein